MKVVFTDDALRDLDEIFQYIFQNTILPFIGSSKHGCGRS